MPQGSNEMARFLLSRVENIECYYVAESEVCAKKTFEETLNALFQELAILGNQDITYLRERYIEIFGGPPQVQAELDDYYENGNVGIHFEITDGSESLVKISLEYCVRSGKFKADGVSIEIKEQSLNTFSALYSDLELATSHIC